MVDDPWLHVRREAVLGELARIQHRFDDAVVHLGRAAETSRRLGFLQTEAYQVSSLGRAQCQAGDYETGAATLELAIEKAEATGDVRMAALARVHLGRVLRALGEGARARTALETATAWHRAAGGGEQAALGECLLAAMDAEERVDGAEERLVAILDEARQNDAAHVEVFALDALARIAVEAGDRATARRPLRRSRSTHGSGLPLHHRARPHRRHLGAADRLRTAPAQTVAPGPSAASVISAASSLWRARLPRSFITMNASRPVTTMAMPANCHPRSSSPSNRNAHTTASAGCATWAMPIVPIGIDFCAYTISPWAATPVRKVSRSMYVHPVPLMPNTSPLAIASGSTVDRGDRTDRRHERRDIHVLAELPRRRDVTDEEEHREHAEHVAFQRRIPVRWRAEQDEAHSAEGDECEHQRTGVDVLLEEPGADRHDEERCERADQRGVGDAVVRGPGEEDGEVQAEEHARYERLAYVAPRDPPAGAPEVHVPDEADGDQPPERDEDAG